MIEEATSRVRWPVLLVERPVGEPTDLARLLVEGGLDVTRVTDLAEAQVGLASEAFAGVVVDLDRGPGDGPEVVAGVRATAPGIPIVALTAGDATGPAGRAAMAEGAYECVSTSGPAAAGLARGVAHAIELSQARDRLQRAEAEHRSVLGSLAPGVVLHDPTGAITYANPSARRMLGLGVDPSTGLTAMLPGWSVVAEDGTDLPCLWFPVTAPSRSGADVSGTVLGVRSPEGHVCWAQVSSRPVPGPQRPPYSVVASFCDVTAWRGAMESSTFRAALLDAVGQAVIATDAEGRITYWNRAAESLYGWGAAEVLGRPVLSVTPPAETAGALAETWAGLLGDGSGTALVEQVRRDGSTFLADVTASSVLDQHGHTVGFIGTSTDVTEREAERRSLAASERSLAEAQTVAHLGSWEWDSTADDVRWSDQLYAMFGRDRATFRPTYEETLAAMVDEDRSAIDATLRQALGQHQPFHILFRIRRPDGEVRWLEGRGAPAASPTPGANRYVGTSLDVTDLQRAAQALRQSEERLAEAQRVAHLGSWSLSLEQDVLEWSDETYRLLGYEPGEVEASIETFLARLHPEDASRLRAVIMSTAPASTPTTWEDESRVLLPDGHVRWLGSRVETVMAPDGGLAGYQGTCLDITERKRVEDELAHLALHDALTGLPNRALLGDRLEQALRQSVPPAPAVAVLFCDVDRFKFVNDSRGHPVGDALLQAVARRLVETTHPDDTVARFGGDEFVVVRTGVGSADEAEAIGTGIARSFDAPFRVGGSEIHASASVGVAVGRAGDSPDALLSAADAAVFRAKSRGGAQAATFDTSLRDQAEARVVSDTALRRALRQSELYVLYQPIVSLGSGRIAGAEALVRWDHPERGALAPAEFIPLAEETGLVVPLGMFVLDEACAAVSRWGGPDRSVYVSVNVSARQLSVPGFAAMVAETVARHRVDPAQLVLEVTEGVFMDDTDFFVGVLGDVKAGGVRVALDDFGTGYSSLSYLRRFPLDVLKVDGSFIQEVVESPKDSAIISAVVGMARALGVPTVVEGVETDAQLAHLRAIGCEYIQGFHVSHPIPADQLAELIEAVPSW
ncbi:MAG: EAL domain-containing protein [Actinomycetota bacterium]